MECLDGGPVFKSPGSITFSLVSSFAFCCTFSSSCSSLSVISGSEMVDTTIPSSFMNLTSRATWIFFVSVFQTLKPFTVSSYLNRMKYLEFPIDASYIRVYDFATFC